MGLRVAYLVGGRMSAIVGASRHQRDSPQSRESSQAGHRSPRSSVIWNRALLAWLSLSSKRGWAGIDSCLGRRSWMRPSKVCMRYVRGIDAKSAVEGERQVGGGGSGNGAHAGMLSLSHALAPLPRDCLADLSALSEPSSYRHCISP